ncbi:histone H1-like [Rhodnius prolixus]|uniref:Putative histone h1 n=1 Tax=Rhodnius prolixus TaxID=13249 RepID=R4FN42_RHOPR
MTETTEQPAAEVPVPVSPVKKGKGSPKKKAVAKSGKKKVSHPPTSQMVTAAIKDLKERGGTSLHAIKKYISTKYNVDAEKMSFFIRKYIRSAVESGELVQTKGKGASGSFKLGGGTDSNAKVSKATSKPKAKKEVTEKKAPAKKAKSSPKKKPSAPKAKKTKKPPTTPKAPKPKKAKPSPAKAKKSTPAKPKAKKPAAKKAASKKK